MKLKRLACALAILPALSLNAQHSVSTGGSTMQTNQIAEGKRVFEMNCSVGYCHGLEGRAGKGPRLRDRVWSKGYLYRTVEKGIPNSSMPAWQGRLTKESVDAVVSYVLSISHEQVSPETGSSKDLSVELQPTTGEDVVAGRQLFFDPLRDRNCGSCHRVAGSGTPVARDFSGLAKRTDEELLRTIVEQPSDSDLIRVKVAEEEPVCGVKVNETNGVLQVYDLGGTGPPVLRTFNPTAIAGKAPCDDMDVHGANARTYTRGELTKIVAFLKSIP